VPRGWSDAADMTRLPERLGVTGVGAVVGGRGRNRLVHGRLLLRCLRLRRVRRRMDGSGRTRAVRRHGPFRRSATQVNGTGLLLVTPPTWEADRMAAQRRRRTAGASPPVPVVGHSAHNPSVAHTRSSHHVPRSNRSVDPHAGDTHSVESPRPQPNDPAAPDSDPTEPTTGPIGRPPSIPPGLDHPSPSMPLLPGRGPSEQVS
jgi:hypothetical protein